MIYYVLQFQLWIMFQDWQIVSTQFAWTRNFKIHKNIITQDLFWPNISFLLIYIDHVSINFHLMLIP